MSKRNLVPQAATPIPGDILSLFGDPPVLSTEDRKIYSDLFCRVAQAVKPKNMIEWIWIKDIVDLSWDIRRLRRYKAQLIEIERRSRLDVIELDEETAKLTPEQRPRPFPQLFPPSSPSKVYKQHQERKKTELHAERGSVMAFLAVIPNYERIDRLLVSAELRRNAVLRDIQFYRESLAHLLRDSTDKIIDAEYEEAPVAAEQLDLKLAD